MSGSALFPVSLARSSARLGISSDFDSVGTHCLAGSLTRLAQISLARDSAQLSSAQLEAQFG